MDLSEQWKDFYYEMGETLKKDKFLSELSKDILNHILKKQLSDTWKYGIRSK